MDTSNPGMAPPLPDPCKAAAPIVIVSSVQDFRLKRRGSIQAIAEELARHTPDVTFLSVRFSALSRRGGDPRMVLLDRANRIESHRGVKCFLWRTPFHPFNARRSWLNVLLTPFFHLYAWYPSADLDRIICSAKTIIIESGLAIALLPRIRRLNPRAKLIYRASDRLATISQHRVVVRILRKHQAAFDSFCLLGPGISADFAWAFPHAFVVPPAFDRRQVEAVSDNPYDGPINAICLGAMLFDPSFFSLVATRVPQVTFHIFGVAPPATAMANIRYHPDIPYEDTWRYVRHASLGVAPYRDHDGAEYLADTSSKLLQYGAVGLPSVCPRFAVGRHPNRFGYTPGDAGSIVAAVNQALATPRANGVPYRDWSEIVPRLLAPRDFPDTLLAGSLPRPSPALSLIVATRGRVDPLARLLSSLRQQPSDLFEVIVVDQNNPGVLDGLLASFSDDLEIIHLRSAPGLSIARNAGLAASRGAIVGFPDDDCWYPAQRAADVVRFFDVYETVDVLLGQTVDSHGLASVNAVRGASAHVTARNVWYSGNSNTLFVRQPLASELRFDEHLGIGAASPFQSGEETDLILRALKRGASAIYCPNLTFFHDQVDKKIGRDQIRRAWKYSTGFGRVLKRHYGPQYFLYRTARSALSSLVTLCRGDSLRSLYRLTWSIGTARGWLASRRSTTNR